MPTNLKNALANFQKKTGEDPKTAKIVRVFCQTPPITRLDTNSLSMLKNCEHFSASTNQIERMVSFGGLPKLRILSLGRNNIKRLEKLEEVSETLEELWLSYNVIEKLSGIEACSKLKVLYMSNNRISSYDELERLDGLNNLEDVLFQRNPIHMSAESDESYRLSVVKRLKHLKNCKLDGVMVTLAEKEKSTVDESVL